MAWAESGVGDPGDRTAYILDDQIGFVLRQAYQRHAALFAERLGESLTPMQWAVLAKLAELGACSQNMLGRLTAMDVATVKGVVERLIKRGLVEINADPDDRRRVALSLSPSGRDLYQSLAGIALEISQLTLAPLEAEERGTLLSLLARLR